MADSRHRTWSCSTWASPDIDGTEVVRRVRAFSEVPVIVLSVRDGSHDKVAALDAGADDYATKPFAMDELLARARATLRRRAAMEPSPPLLVFGGLEVDLARRLVTRDAEVVHLTPTEYSLLEALATNPGSCSTHQWLLRKVWGHGYRLGDHVPPHVCSRPEEEAFGTPCFGAWALILTGARRRVSMDRRVLDAESPACRPPPVPNPVPAKVC